MPQLILLHLLFHVGLVEKQKETKTNKMLFIIISSSRAQNLDAKFGISTTNDSFGIKALDAKFGIRITNVNDLDTEVVISIQK